MLLTLQGTVDVGHAACRKDKPYRLTQTKNSVFINTATEGMSPRSAREGRTSLMRWHLEVTLQPNAKNSIPRCNIQVLCCEMKSEQSKLSKQLKRQLENLCWLKFYESDCDSVILNWQEAREKFLSWPLLQWNQVNLRDENHVFPNGWINILLQLFWGSLLHFLCPSVSDSSKESIWKEQLQSSWTAAHRFQPAAYKIHCHSATLRSHSSASPTAS